MNGFIRVTVEDLDTGGHESVEIKDDYVIICAGECYISHTQDFGNWNHILTIKGRGKGSTKRSVPISDDHEPELDTPTERALYRDCKRFKEERDRYREALEEIMSSTATYPKRSSLGRPGQIAKEALT